MIIPKKLQIGDKIAIVCTARSITKGELKPALAILYQWGLQVVLGTSIGQQHHQFGGTDQERAKDLQQQINDPGIKAIWCARGGYGSARIVDQIDFKPLKKNPKWIIGYSDITALHLHLQGIGIASLHAQMPLDIQSKTAESIDSLYQSLFYKPYTIQYRSTFLSKSGIQTGTLLGGNLSVLYSILGSKSTPDFSDTILFIEDVEEYLYHIDRMILNLKRSQVLHKLKGLIVGGMSSMNDNSIPFGKSAYQIIEHHTRHLDIPIAYDCPVGHGYHNIALTMGDTVELKIVNNEVTIKYVSNGRT